MKTVTVQLVKKTQTGVDELNRPVFSGSILPVGGVLVAPSDSSDIDSSLSLYGKKAQYTLGIPKGDTNDWDDTEVILPAPFEGRYKTIGYSTAGIEENIPLKWNRKVMVEKYG